MQAYELHPEEGFDALRLIERPAPSAPGAHDVVVRIRAVSLNYRDLAVARAAKRRAKRIVPASDGAGEVVAVGERVTRVKVGDRVAAAFFPTWMSGGLTKEHHAHALGGSIDGMLAEQVVLPESAWVQCRALSLRTAATLPCAGVAAWHALYVAATYRAQQYGSWSGARAASRSSRCSSAHATGAGSDHDLQLARRRRAARAGCGAMKTINYQQTRIEQNHARGGPRPRHGISPSKSAARARFNQSVRALATDGTMSILGILAGSAGTNRRLFDLPDNLRIMACTWAGFLAMFEDLVGALEPRNRTDA